MEDGHRCPQSYSGEYGWLGPDITQNTRGRYILILAAILIALVLLQSSSLKSTVPNPGLHYLPLA